MADEGVEKPTYMNSTFSIITIIVVLAFVALCLYKQDLISLERITFSMLGAYGIKKGMEVGGKKS